ncbi:MAG: hypothetical protein MRY83_15490 [Flavobacteriales bacterium]|nr:hypothetical protein [Flavobacteriales bacterium]
MKAITFILIFFAVHFNAKPQKNGDLFSMKLIFDAQTTDNTPKYSGVPSSVQWINTDHQNSYNIVYDDHNQIRKADYFNKVNPTKQTPSLSVLENVNYDANGNILHLDRKNLADQVIDQLVYHYGADNRLLHLEENANVNEGYNGQTGQFLYDQNGNLTNDQSKGVKIFYNAMNRPYLFIDGNNDSLVIKYLANGVKYEQSTQNHSKKYSGGFEYIGANLESIRHSEGRTTRYGTYFQNEFVIRDHLGSHRVMFCDLNQNDKIDKSTEVLQKKDYYPFGGLIENNSVTQGTENQYGYNGKENVDHLDLQTIDYGARFYDPYLARWSAVDPKAEDYLNFSPYNYVLNSPLANIDPNGEEVDMVFDQETGTLTIKDMDHYNPDLPNVYVGPDEYSFVDEYVDEDGNRANQVLVIHNVFSGGVMDDEGNFSRTLEYGEYPIPNGFYHVLEYEKDKPSTWYRIDAIDSKPFNDVHDGYGATNIDGEQRSQLRMHVGSISTGCINICKYTTSEKQWNVVEKMINNTSYTWANKNDYNDFRKHFSFRKNYGKLQVVGARQFNSKSLFNATRY